MPASQTLQSKSGLHISRLERAERAALKHFDEIIKYCADHNIPFDIDFIKRVVISDSILREFEAAYKLPEFPKTTLPKRGSNVVLVMESKQGASNHGEVVATIASAVGSSLSNSVQTVYIKASINPTYRQIHEGDSHKTISILMENLGPAVFHTSIGWEDKRLFQGSTFSDSHQSHLGEITAFVVDSAGNDGMYGDSGTFVPAQKHNAVSHIPPLVVHVGAAELKEDGSYHIAGYSSANSPTFVAPVKPAVKLKWHGDRDIEPVLGTSSSAPFVSGGLAALNDIYGRYLTKEQILYAVIATCEKINDVDKFGKKTPDDLKISYKKNAAGNEYNSDYAGFGLVDFHKAEKLLAHMAHYAQEHPQQITIPEQTSAKISITSSDEHKDENGKFRYKLQMPSGLCLKTIFSINFVEEAGKEVVVKSPSGSEYPVVLSRFLKGFGISTTHAWAGEKLEGEWEIITDSPVKNITMTSHHFQARDLIKDVRFEEIENLERPDLSHAKTVVEHLNLPTQRIARATSFDAGGLTIDGVKPESLTPEVILHLLNITPDGIKKRTRISTPIKYGPEQGKGWQIESQAYGYNTVNSFSIMKRATLFEEAAKTYEEDSKLLASANNYSMAAQEWRRYPHFEDEFGNLISEKAIPLFQKAIDIHEKLGHFDHMYRDMDKMYSAVIDTIRGYRFKYDQQNAEKYERIAEDIIAKIPSVASSVEGEKDPKAHRIEEAEYGFSSDEPIGTDRVSQCLTLVAQSANGKDKKTGLVHIDREIDLTTLNRFFSHFPDGPLKMRVVGARFDSDLRSLENIVNTVRTVKDTEIDIISADTWGGDKGPSAVVVDPKTFEIKEAVPGVPNPNYDISNGIVLFTSSGKPLVKCFDFTESPLRAPIFLDSKAVAMLRGEYLDRTLTEIDDIMHKYAVQDRALMVGHLRGLIKEYRKALAPLEEHLEARINQIKRQFPMTEEPMFEEARRTIINSEIYIGENAEKANKPLINAINNLFVVQDRKVTLDIHKFHQAELPIDGYSAVNPASTMAVKYGIREDSPPGGLSSL